MAKGPYRIQKGDKAHNPTGRPTVPKGRSISRLRRTLNKLKQLEPDAIEVIEQSILGEDIDKARVDTAKWLIGTLATLTRTSIAEEQAKDAFKKEKMEDMAEAGMLKEATNNKPVRFQTTIVGADDTDDDED